MTESDQLRAANERLTAALSVARRLLPARYFDADGNIMDPARCTPHAPDCAECGRGRAHDEACLGVQETPAEEIASLLATADAHQHMHTRAVRAEAEVERLQAELEEARLTWLAQRGNPEGAPSKGWSCSFGRWTKDLPNGDMLVVEGGHWSMQYKWEDHATYQHWTIRRTPAGHMLMGWGDGPWGRSDRAAMKAADNATLEKS